MAMKGKKEKKGKFIQEQLDGLKQEQSAMAEKVEVAKNAFAASVGAAIDIEKEQILNEDYFNDVLHRIDVDRLATQNDIAKIDEEIEKEEKQKDDELKKAKQTLLEKKFAEMSGTTPDIIEETKQEPEKKLSFFDKLLRIL